MLETRHRWTPKEAAYLAASYDGTGVSYRAIAGALGLRIQCIKGKIQGLKLAKVHRRKWTQQELNILSNNIGVVSDKELCKRLNRSTNALKIAAYRKLNGMNKRSNIYTARAVAAELGIG